MFNDPSTKRYYETITFWNVTYFLTKKILRVFLVKNNTYLELDIFVNPYFT